MSNGRSKTYQLQPLEGFETVAGDQTLRSQYSIVPENMRDEIENREVWSSIGDIGEGVWNIASGTAEGFGYDLSNPSSLLADLALTMFLPPTLRNAAKSVKRTKKGLNPYQKTELIPKQSGDAVEDMVRTLQKEGKISMKPPSKRPSDLPPLTKSQKEAQDLMLREFAKEQRIKDIKMLENFTPRRLRKPVMDSLAKLRTRAPEEIYGKTRVPMQKATTATKPNNIKKLLPLLLAMGGKSPEGDSEENILDSLIIDMEPMEFRKPNFEEQVLNMLKEDSKWRY